MARRSRRRNSEPEYTYAWGFHVVVGIPVTTKTIVDLCDMLKARFEERYGGTYRFVPEPITEGGIVMVDWRGREMAPDSAYKTVRTGHDRTHGNWPWIVPGTEASWRAQPAAVIFSSTRDEAHREYDDSTPELALFFKAFHGAPCWTREELEIIRGCFHSLGFATKGRIPRASVLRSRGDLGVPISGGQHNRAIAQLL